MQLLIKKKKTKKLMNKSNINVIIFIANALLILAEMAKTICHANAMIR